MRVDDVLRKLTPEHFADGRIPSRSTLSERLAGVGLRPDFIEAVADVCSKNAAGRDRLLAEAEAARQQAGTVSSSTGAGNSVVEAQLVIVQQRSLAVSDKLVRAMERASQLERERNDANQMVLVLLAMVDKLHRDVDTLARERDRLRSSRSVHTELEQVHERLSRSEQQRVTAEAELDRARAERQKADQLAEEAAEQVRLLREELERLRGEGSDPDADDSAPLPTTTPDVQDSWDGTADDIDVALIKAARHLDDRADRLDQLAGELHMDNPPDNSSDSDVTADNSSDDAPDSETENPALPPVERSRVSFEAFRQVHYPVYLAWAHTYLSDAADAENAVNAAFEELLRNWTEVLKTESAAAYSWQVMKHHTLGFAQSLGRRHSLVDSAAFETIALREAADPVGQLEETLSLFRAIDALPERQRDIIVLTHLHGHSINEAAHHLGIGPATARHVSHQARRGIERYLGLAGK
jgi:RNA polymerase sigma factor (sigma-70 family)